MFRLTRKHLVRFMLVACALALIALIVGSCTETIFTKSGTGFAVAGTGDVWRNAGGSWQKVHAGDFELNYVSAAGKGVVWACDRLGRVIRSVDNGGTWIRKYASDYDYLSGLYALDASTAWAWGGRSSDTHQQQSQSYDAIFSTPILLKTSDGGTTWHETPFPDQFNLGFGGNQWISSASKKHVWAIGTIAKSWYWQAAVFKSSDTGATWSPTGFPHTSDFWPLSIEGIDARTAWTFGTTPYEENPEFGVTRDGGATWYIKHLDMWRMWGFAAGDANAAWMVGKQGSVIHTENGGKDWKDQQSGTKNRLEAIAATDAQHAIAVGEHGVVLTTSDGGSTWSKSLLGDDIHFVSVSVPRSVK